MIRLQIKNQRLLGDALYAVVSVIAFIWISLGWLVMMPWTSSNSLLHPAKPLAVRYLTDIEKAFKDR